MEPKTESFILSVSFTDENKGVLIVGKQTKGQMEIINAFQDKEAYELYEKIVTKNISI